MYRRTKRRLRQRYTNVTFLSTSACWHWASLVLIWLSLQGIVLAQDNRCYLLNGGSSETFTVNELLPVDSVIGTLQIAGNASEDGDIELTIAKPDSPITFQPFTKNLVLKKKLDKEGVEGLSSVALEVSCSKIGSTSDPSITIPVRIIVTDANDNAPQFVGAPYTLNISEVTVVGTTVMRDTILAIDKDQRGPYNTVEYHVLPGPHSDYLAFESRLQGNLVLTAPLDYETLPKFTLQIKAQDQGEPPQTAITTLTVNVLDADDQNPRFLAERYTAELPEDTKPGTVLNIRPSTILAEDPDEGIRSPITYHFNADTTEYSYFNIDPKTAKVSIRSVLPKDLALPLTLVIRAIQEDNPDRYTLTTLTIGKGSHLLPLEMKFLQNEYMATVLESTPPDHVLLTVQTSQSLDKNVKYALLDNPGEEFAIRSTGEIILAKRLDYETQQEYNFKVLATSGPQSDIAHIHIKVIDVNDHDPEFSLPQYVFKVPDTHVHVGYLLGKIEVIDRDINDTVELSLKGPFANVFSINNQGELRIRNLDLLNATVCHLIVVATDNGAPPRHSSIPVEVHFPQELMLGAAFRPRSEESSYVLMIVFGVLLGTLFIVIITLTTYILKHKSYRDDLHESGMTSSEHQNGKVTNFAVPHVPSESKSPNNKRTSGLENPVFNMSENKNESSNGKEIDSTKDSEIVDIVRGSLRRSSNQMSPVANGQVGKLETVMGGSKIHNIHWPNGSIPKRVKKLSWEDEQLSSRQTELDPEVSVTPLARLQEASKPPDLTVYF